MQLKSQADIDWFGWSFLWILTRQMLGICLRLHFYELTPASDITSATQLKKCQRVRMHIYTDLKSNLLNWVIKTEQNQTNGSPKTLEWISNEWALHIFSRNYQRYLLWYHDRLLIKLADIDGLHRGRLRAEQRSLRSSVFRLGSVGDDIMCFCSNTWFIASFGQRL